MTGVGEQVAAVADAVLFEGYLLYPYRASAQKNRLRWQFGVLAGRDWAREHGETWFSRTECLLEPRPDTVLGVRLRFLRQRRRQVRRNAPGGFVDVPELTVADRLHLTWDEGVPETVDAEFPLVALLDGRCEWPVALPGDTSEEWLDEDGRTVGRVVRRRWPLQARIVAGAVRLPGPYGVVRLSLRVENTGPAPSGADGDATDGAEPGAGRDRELRSALIGAHTILTLSAGEFLSMTDPPEWARPAAAGCVNEHTWPVLAGPRTRPSVMLSSPIILADFPEIAPESPNELYDGTENDEILTLRTMALTDAEKREARATDPRAAELVDAVDGLPPELVERLHGVIRSMSGPGVPAGSVAGPSSGSAAGSGSGFGGSGFGGSGSGFGGSGFGGSGCGGAGPGLDDVPTYCHDTGGRPWWDPAADAAVDPETDVALVDEHPVAKGSVVTLRPAGRADAQDLFLAGRRARVEAVLHDVDGDVHLAVSLLDDPGADLHAAHGRYRYFRPNEVEITPAEITPAEMSPAEMSPAAEAAPVEASS